MADPMHQFEVHKVVDIPPVNVPGLGLIDISITNSSLAMMVAFGLVVALLLNTGIKGVTFYRVLYFVPVVTATVAAAR